MAFSRDFSDVGISSSDTILNRWSHVSMSCIFIGCLIEPISARFSRWPHTVRNLSRGAKNIKHVWFYPHSLARRIFHHNFPAHVRKRLSRPPREAVCSALSSPCATGWSPPCEQNLLLSFSLPRRRKVGSARIASTLWSRRSPNFWTSQSCFLSSNRFFQCERQFSDKTDGYNWARCTMKNQDGGEICHIRLGFETASWQHAAHTQ